jgi:hypothetical protein
VGAAVTASSCIVPVKAGGGLFSTALGKSRVAGVTSEECGLLTSLCADINAMRDAVVELSTTDKITAALAVAPTASATDAMRRPRPRLDAAARWPHSGSKLPTDRITNPSKGERLSAFTLRRPQILLLSVDLNQWRKKGSIFKLKNLLEVQQQNNTEDIHVDFLQESHADRRSGSGGCSALRNAHIG